MGALFSQQLAAANDTATFIACLCTRRAGKSYWEGIQLIQKALDHSGSIVPYIALTRKSAKNIMWPILKELNERFNLKMRLKEHELEAVLENDARIVLFGADRYGWIDMLRGGKYPFVAIDEAGSFGPHLNELVDDVLTPAIIDYNGQIALVGTPGLIPQGLFYEATTEPEKVGFSLHKWTIYDNPHVPHATNFVEGLKKRKGWSDENPTYLREWQGQWVNDADSLVYKYRPGRNDYQSLPESEEWFNILGVDYGWHDQAAFSVISYNPNSPKIFVQDCMGYSEMIPSKIADHLTNLIDQYQPIHIVADTGGLGKSITEEMIQRYGLPIEPAKKTDKLTHISLLNGDLIDGHLKIHNDLKLLKSQMQTLPRDEQGKEDPRFPNDLCDSVLYAYRAAKAYSWEPAVPKAKTQEEKYAAEAKRIEDSLIRKLEKEQSQEWWERE